MKNKLLGICLGLFPLITYANDSTGYVSTGGIKYIKNKNIAMESEDLYISEKKIDVAYQFRNLTNRDITETILFPLPAFGGNEHDGEFADVEALFNSFRVKVNGYAIRPTRHVNIVFPQNEAGNKFTDITSILAKCGVSEKLLLDSWTQKIESTVVNEKIAACSNQTLQKLLNSYGNWENNWLVKVTYSWQQTFKAHSVTRVEHHYQPLVGGGFDVMQGLSRFCTDKNFNQKLSSLRKKNGNPPLFLTRELSYVLTTGANWAKPIGKFTLTIERKPNELVSLCWDKSLKKISATQFRAVKTNFIPKKDIDVVFIH